MTKFNTYQARKFRYKKRRNIASEVLQAFQKVSPSRIEIEDEGKLKDYTQKHYNLFYRVLKFPPQLFNGKKVLDFGCGTGEVDLVLAGWGADVEGFDFNPDSIERAQTLKEIIHVDGRVNFSIGDVYAFEFNPASYDFVISMGVIAHVEKQRLMFKRMVEACKPGGFIILGYIDSAGLIQRLLHRAIIKSCKNSLGLDEAGIHKMALSLFGEHIERSVQMGGRTASSVINDYLVNPHYLGIDINEIMKWVLEENLDLYSYWPSLEKSFSIDSPYGENSPIKSTVFKSWSSFLKFRWMYALGKDEEVFSKLEHEAPCMDEEIESLFFCLNDVLQNENLTEENIDTIKIELNKIEGKINTAMEKFQNYISSSIAELNSELVDVLELIFDASEGQVGDVGAITNRLFRGYNGLGTNYMILCKEV